MRYFAACIPWSAAIGVVSALLAAGAGVPVTSAGPALAIAALTEEGLKLLPVALVALAAPRRASRFATVDWLLLGMASGTAFTPSSRSRYADSTCRPPPGSAQLTGLWSRSWVMGCRTGGSGSGCTCSRPSTRGKASGTPGTREQAERDRVAAERHEELIAKIAEAAPRSASP